MTWFLIPAASLVPKPWRNGHGTSRDILTVEAAGALLYQVSIADLERDAPFSHYPGLHRIFTPIAGEPPPELAFHGGPFEACPLLVPKPFAGDIPTLSRIPAPGRAFNVIHRVGAVTATVDVLRLGDGEAVTVPRAHAVLVHCLAGALAAAKPGDTLLGPGSDPLEATAPGTIALRVALTLQG